jgi:hypothetical protein
MRPPLMFRIGRLASCGCIGLLVSLAPLLIAGQQAWNAKRHVAAPDTER